MTDILCRNHDHPVGDPYHGPACPQSNYPIGTRVRVAISDPGAVLDRLVDGDDYESIPAWSARAVEAVIAALARHNPPALLGEPRETRVLHSVHWHGQEFEGQDDPPTRLSDWDLRTLQHAVRRGDEQVAKQEWGITWFTISRRERRIYDSGVSWDSAWETVPAAEIDEARE